MGDQWSFLLFITLEIFVRSLFVTFLGSNVALEPVIKEFFRNRPIILDLFVKFKISRVSLQGQSQITDIPPSFWL